LCTCCSHSEQCAHVVLLHSAGVFRLEKRPPAIGSTPATFLGLQPDAAQALLAGKRCQQLLTAYKARLLSHLQQQGSSGGDVIELELASKLRQAGGLLDQQLRLYTDKVRWGLEWGCGVGCLGGVCVNACGLFSKPHCCTPVPDGSTLLANNNCRLIKVLSAVHCQLNG
jgi:hypothetical protein